MAITPVTRAKLLTGCDGGHRSTIRVGGGALERTTRKAVRVLCTVEVPEIVCRLLDPVLIVNLVTRVAFTILGTAKNGMSARHTFRKAKTNDNRHEKEPRYDKQGVMQVVGGTYGSTLGSALA